MKMAPLHLDIVRRISIVIPMLLPGGFGRIVNMLTERQAAWRIKHSKRYTTHDRYATNEVHYSATYWKDDGTVNIRFQRQYVNTYYSVLVRRFSTYNRTIGFNPSSSQDEVRRTRQIFFTSRFVCVSAIKLNAKWWIFKIWKTRVFRNTVENLDNSNVYESNFSITRRDVSDPAFQYRICRLNFLDNSNFSITPSHLSWLMAYHSNYSTHITENCQNNRIRWTFIYNDNVDIWDNRLPT